MAFFTNHEKKIFIFLCISFLAGSLILLAKKNIPFFYDFLSLNEFKREFSVIHSKKPLQTEKKETIGVNINSATYDELIEIPYIGPKIANKIIEMRKNITFNNYNDLKTIPGIGDKKLLKIKKYFSFDSSKH
ncbi:MAG: helix-hairpin-helix domain-containing protein [Candidatus Firestonebacteria bacterium]|nr:helix-hairpin-helix domain-containing protein [Candidatus Firestonebacteria bacterium]